MNGGTGLSRHGLWPLHRHDRLRGTTDVAGILAVLPTTMERGLGVTTFYLSSTSLLIVVGVALDTMTQIEARLAMRDYKGFIKR